jgi:hypothetical protein
VDVVEVVAPVPVPDRLVPVDVVVVGRAVVAVPVRLDVEVRFLAVFFFFFLVPEGVVVVGVVVVGVVVLGVGVVWATNA